MKAAIIAFLAICAACWSLAAQAQPLAPYPPPPYPPFPEGFSNTLPLVFGMDEQSAATALGAPFNYIRGRPGDEVFLVLRDGHAGFFSRHDRLYLQFRRGRLTGWKGDWGQNWMWQ